jgi:hypothetical protein
MPDRETIERAQEDAREGKSPSTQAGEFVREEMHHIREGKHGASSTKQAIAIGLSKARRAGVKLNVPAPGKASAETRTKAARDLGKGQSHSRRKPSARRSRATSRALKRESRNAASPSVSGTPGAQQRPSPGSLRSPASSGEGTPHKRQNRPRLG